MTNEKLTVKKVVAIVVLTVILTILCCGFFFITVLIVSAMTGNFVLAFVSGLLPTLTIVVGLSTYTLLQKRRKNEERAILP